MASNSIGRSAGLGHQYDSTRALIGMQRQLGGLLRGAVNPEMGGKYDDLLSFVMKSLPMRTMSHAQLSQDLWVLYELSDLSEGYFVEFGACDGVFLSNTLLLEQEFGWSGIVCEPNPVYHPSLSVNRACHVDKRCVAATSGEAVEFWSTLDPEFSTISSYAQDDMHAARRASSFEATSMTAVSLNDMLASHEAPSHINYLSIDTEGSEFDILNNFDFSRYELDLITVEHNWGPNRRGIHDLLLSKGFSRKFEGLTLWDDWYTRL